MNYSSDVKTTAYYFQNCHIFFLGPSCHLFGVTQTEDKPSPETGVLEPKKILGNSENNTLVLIAQNA